MPRRTDTDDLSRSIGERIRQLRDERGLTLEKLAYESEISKGHLSDIENGRVRVTSHTLDILADGLEVALLDLVTFRDAGPRHELVDLTRGMTEGNLKTLLEVARRETGTD
jgi:transcriptional regulator with XRE-family HTH domain